MLSPQSEALHLSRTPPPAHSRLTPSPASTLIGRSPSPGQRPNSRSSLPQRPSPLSHQDLLTTGGNGQAINLSRPSSREQRLSPNSQTQPGPSLMLGSQPMPIFHGAGLVCPPRMPMLGHVPTVQVLHVPSHQLHTQGKGPPGPLGLPQGAPPIPMPVRRPSPALQPSPRQPAHPLSRSPHDTAASAAEIPGMMPFTKNPHDVPFSAADIRGMIPFPKNPHDAPISAADIRGMMPFSKSPLDAVIAPADVRGMLPPQAGPTDALANLLRMRNPEIRIIPPPVSPKSDHLPVPVGGGPFLGPPRPPPHVSFQAEGLVQKPMPHMMNMTRLSTPSPPLPQTIANETRMSRVPAQDHRIQTVPPESESPQQEVPPHPPAESLQPRRTSMTPPHLVPVAPKFAGGSRSQSSSPQHGVTSQHDQAPHVSPQPQQIRHAGRDRPSDSLPAMPHLIPEAEVYTKLEEGTKAEDIVLKKQNNEVLKDKVFAKPEQRQSTGMSLLKEADRILVKKEDDRQVKVEAEEENKEAADLIPIQNPFNMRVMNLNNFPSQQTGYRSNFRSHSVAILKAKAGSITNPARSLDLLRQNLQMHLNKEIDRIMQKYVDRYFKPGIENVEKNVGENSIAEDHIQAVCRQILEEAKKMYNSDSRSGTPDISDNVSDTGSTNLLYENRAIREKKINLHPWIRKRRGSFDSDESTTKRKKKGRPAGVSGRSTPNKNKNEPVKREGPKWDPERLTTETEFVMGARANKALGLGNTRGRLYIKHPSLFKYCGDQDDKTWLYENHRMPATGGKAYLLVVSDIEELAETEEYKNLPGLMLNEIVGFTVPEWMIEKMKGQMQAMRTDIPRPPKQRVRTSTPNNIPTSLGPDGDDQLPFSSLGNVANEIKEIPDGDNKSDETTSSPSNPENMDTLSNGGQDDDEEDDEDEPPSVSPFNMAGGFNDISPAPSSPVPSDFDDLDDDPSFTPPFQLH